MLEGRMADLAESMQRFADAMTNLARLDERMAQLLMDNRSLGERVGHLQETVQETQVTLASMQVEVSALKESRRGVGHVVTQVGLWVLGVVILALLGHIGIKVGGI